MSDYWKDKVIEAAKVWIEARHAVRSRPEGFSSVRRKTPEFEEFERLCEIERAAEAELWMLTDSEYDEDGFWNYVWEWRYWRVMCRKCIWYQRHGGGDAGATMAKLQEAENNFMMACGLGDIYKPSSHYIESFFPNLKPLNNGPKAKSFAATEF